LARIVAMIDTPISKTAATAIDQNNNRLRELAGSGMTLDISAIPP
jgi:hypothetical protein